MGWCTILTPLFNGIEYFKECYDSVIAQTDPDWKWIIGVNGHGEDSELYNTLKKIDDPRIVVHNYLTVGKVDTLNKMLSEVSSNYIAILDCDDIWFPQKLEFQKQILLANPSIDVLGTGCTYIGTLSHSPVLPVGKIDLEVLLQGTNPIINSSVVCKKEELYWDSKWYGLDDYDLWIRLAMKGKTLYTVPNSTLFHRIHANSAFNSSGAQDLDGLLNHTKKVISDVSLVSAYYPIVSKYSTNQYMEWIAPFWSKLKCNIIFFTTPTLVNYFKNILNSRATVVGLPFDELEAFKKYGLDFWKSQLVKDHEPDHSAELYALWYEKKEFVLKAIALNPYNTSKFVWCDAGICRSESWLATANNFPTAYKLPKDKLCVLRITDFEDLDNFQYINTVGGGILGGSIEVWNSFSTMYDTMLKKYVAANKFVGKDQSIIASIVKEDPGMFHLVKGDPRMDGFTVWFSLLFYLSFP